MKQITFCVLLAFLFVTCKRQCICKGYSVDQNPCGCVILKGKIGNDFDTALDSLKRYYEPKFNVLETEGHYSGKGYFVRKEKLNVDFVDDDRDFFWLTFIDSVNIYRYIATWDVIDEKGNYYIYDVGGYER